MRTFSYFQDSLNATESMMLNVMTESSQTVDVMMVLSTIIASVGIVANFTVIVVFLNKVKQSLVHTDIQTH